MREGGYQELYELLHFDEILARIEPDRSRWSRLHLILVPDGLLFQFSLLAAYCKAEDRRLYQQVASLRYALSLRTLELQQQIQDRRAALEAGDYQLRGVLFANPDQGKRRLPGVITEVANVIAATGSERWWVHGECEPEQAVCPSMQSRHPSGNVLMASFHGGWINDPQMPGPGLSLCDGGLSDSRMVAEGYTFEEVWLLYWSCCLLGQLNPEERTKEVEGFMATLIMLGCRRVLSALWPISDKAAADLSRHWIKASMDHVFNRARGRGPHSFALAFKAALESFRQADGGYYDHELYWAPYLFYGLG
jgi:CHAT domain-containing protein